MYSRRSMLMATCLPSGETRKPSKKSAASKQVTLVIFCVVISTTYTHFPCAYKILLLSSSHCKSNLGLASLVNRMASLPSIFMAQMLPPDITAILSAPPTPAANTGVAVDSTGSTTGTLSAVGDKLNIAVGSAVCAEKLIPPQISPATISAAIPPKIQSRVLDNNPPADDLPADEWRRVAGSSVRFRSGVSPRASAARAKAKSVAVAKRL